jgi:hypothetical protein
MLKENLDKRICDIECMAENTQTYREFLEETLNDLYGRNPYCLDNMSSDHLTQLLEFCDEMWDK